MSYILDALKRADQERQLGKNAAVLNGPAVDQAGQPSPWLPRLLMVLALALLIAVISYWLTKQWQMRTHNPPAVPVEVPATQPAPTAFERVEPIKPVKQITAVDGLQPNVAPQVIATVVAESSEPEPEPEPDKAAAEPIAAAPSSALDSEPETLPLLSDLPSSYRQGVPSLEIQFHRYSKDPARRFVMVDGQRYGEGDTLAAGPKLEAIVTGGIQLGWRGLSFIYPLP